MISEQELFLKEKRVAYFEKYKKVMDMDEKAIYITDFDDEPLVA